MIRRFDLSSKGLKDAQVVVLNLGEIISSHELMKYIEQKCEKELNKILRQEVFYNWDRDEIWNYRKSFNAIIRKNCVIIYNNATIDIAEKIAKSVDENGEPRSKIDVNKYPTKLSLAKLVEYGTGIVGAVNTDQAGVSKDWQYDVNNHGGKGWIYYDDDLKAFILTRGTEGKLIFYKLKLVVKQKINGWVKDYIKEKMQSEKK